MFAKCQTQHVGSRCTPGLKGGDAATAIRSHLTPAHYRYVRRRWRFLFRLIDSTCTVLPDALMRVTVRRRAVWPPRRILLVQLDHIGDAVLSSGIPAFLKRAFPRSEVHVLCSSWSAGLFQALPEVDRAIVAARNWHARVPDRYSLLGAVLDICQVISRIGYDAAIDLRGDFPTILALWLAGVPIRAGLDCAGGRRLLTHVAPWDPHGHELQNRWHAVRLLVPECSVQDIKPRLTPSASELSAIRHRLKMAGAGRPLVVAHVGAGTESKRWPTHYYHELVCELRRVLGATCVLVGSRDGAGSAKRLVDMGTPAINWVGKLPLSGLIALVHEADAFVGPDSGPAHIAATVGAPTVVLFSGTNRNSQWMPVGRYVIPLAFPTPCGPCSLKRCPMPAHPCMAGITPDLVGRVLTRVLREHHHDVAEPQPETEAPARDRLVLTA